MVFKIFPDRPNWTEVIALEVRELQGMQEDIDPGYEAVNYQ